MVRKHLSHCFGLVPKFVGIQFSSNPKNIDTKHKFDRQASAGHSSLCTSSVITSHVYLCVQARNLLITFPLPKNPTRLSTEEMPFLRRRRKHHREIHCSLPHEVEDDQNRDFVKTSGRHRFLGPTNRWSRSLSAGPSSSRPVQTPKILPSGPISEENINEADEGLACSFSPVVVHQESTAVGDADVCSEVSLLSAWSSDEDLTRCQANISELERVRGRLDQRARLLGRLTVQTSVAYRDMMIARENDARTFCLESHGIALDEDTRSTGHGTLAVSHGSRILDAAKNHLLFEGSHALEALWNITWYSLGHLAVYMGLDATSKLVRAYLGIAEGKFHVFLMSFAMMTIRLNGYIWQWQGRNSYQLVKFDFHNRQMLNMWDASLMSKLHRDYEAINEFISILAYYLVFISLSHFYNKVWAAYEMWITWGYTHMELQWTKRLEEIGASFESCDSWQSTVCPEGDECSSFFRQILESCLTRVMTFLCLQFSDPAFPVPSILFHWLFCGLSFLAIGVFGFRLFEM
jgi:hypothetical protein